MVDVGWFQDVLAEIKSFRARRTSLEADFARCFVVTGGDAGIIESLATELDRETSLGVR